MKVGELLGGFEGVACEVGVDELDYVFGGVHIQRHLQKSVSGLALSIYRSDVRCSPDRRSSL